MGSPSFVAVPELLHARSLWWLRRRLQQFGAAGLEELGKFISFYQHSLPEHVSEPPFVFGQNTFGLFLDFTKRVVANLSDGFGRCGCKVLSVLV